MEILEDPMEGTLVLVNWDDDLAGVPEAFQPLLTPEVRAFFATPRLHLERIVRGCPFPHMSRYFRKWLDEGQGRLELQIGDPAEIMRQAGFSFEVESVRSATIGVPIPLDGTPRPAALTEFYRRVGFVDWMGVMCSGKLYKPNGLPSLAVFGDDDYPVDLHSTRMIGDSPCGDMMFVTADDRGGWWCHETRELLFLGSSGDLIDWVFSELLAKRTPDYWTALKQTQAA